MPWALVEADIVRGRMVTSWPSIKTDLTNAGAKWVDEEVVVDGITAGPQFDSATSNRKVLNEPDRGGMNELEVNGAGPVYYYEPVGPGRHSMRPLLVYLHGRGGDAEQDCRKWASVARRFGWLVCPSGPVAHNSGRSTAK